MKAFLQKMGYALDLSTNVWVKHGYRGINYTDGDGAELRIARIIDDAADITVLSPELRRNCTDWPSLYHLSGTRANILRPFAASLSGDILEVGAGCGAITRYLGECGANVLALEGNPRRATIARSRTRDLENVTVLAEKFDALQCDRQFDVITLIGVLEYANLFTSGENPALEMLGLARHLLKPDGKLIIAIENQLGLKYFAGAPEDHLGQPMYGIEGRYRKDQPKTFGRKVLAHILDQAGFAASEFLAPFPDYKLPVSILTEEGINNKNFDAAAFAWQSARRDPQLPPYCGFSLELAWPEIFENEMALDVANSFLIIASPNAQQHTDRGVLAFHYSTDRMPQFCKETRFVGSGPQIDVIYQQLITGDENMCADEGGVISFNCPVSAKYSKGKALSWEFVRTVTRDGWTVEEVGVLLKRYLSMLETLANKAGLTLSFTTTDTCLPGRFFDVVPQNIIMRADGTPEAIDTEWTYHRDVELGYLLFRALLLVIGSVTRFGNNAIERNLTRIEFVETALRSAGFVLSEQDFSRFIEIESIVQERVTGRPAREFLAWWPDQPLPLVNLNQALSERDGQIANLNRTLTEREEKIANLSQTVIERDGQIANLNQAVVGRDGQITDLKQTIAQIEQRLTVLTAAKDHPLREFKRKLARHVKLLYWQQKLLRSSLFDSEWYLAHYPDVAQQGINPLRHYLAFGWKENRQPGSEFDGKYYRTIYPDIPGDLPPLVHYWLYGRFEGRHINPALDLEWEQADAHAVCVANNLEDDVGQPNQQGTVFISVVIPTYNRIKLLPEIITAWRKVHACTSFSYEIIFSDDGSSDSSVEYLETLRDLPLRVLRNGHGGASSARNAAIKAARGERLLIIGDDIYPDPEILNIHAKLGKQLGPMVAILGVVNWHNKLEINHLMHHITEIGNEQFSYNRLTDGAYVDFRHFYACNISVSRSLLLEEKVIFDERFNEYGYEDIELGYRLSLRGMKILFTTSAKGDHYHPYTTAHFCRRQISAGRMGVVFAGIHPGVSPIIGVEVIAREQRDAHKLPSQDAIWQGRLEMLVHRCDVYEHLVATLPKDKSMAIRQCLSTVYTSLFRAMYEYGVWQKLGNTTNALTVAMTRYFGGLGSNYWSMLAQGGGLSIDLTEDELFNLNEALNTGRADDLLYGSEQRAVFEELIQTKALTATEVLTAGTWHRLKYLASRTVYYLINNPGYLVHQVRQVMAPKTHQKPIATKVHSNATNVQLAIPAIVVEPYDLNREDMIAAYRDLFGNRALAFERVSGERLVPLYADGSRGVPVSPSAADATVFFWPMSIRALQNRDHLISAYMALIENGLSVTLISHSLSVGQTVFVGELRDNLLFSRDVAQAVLNGTLGDTPLTGKVLRLLPAYSDVREQKINTLINGHVDLDAEGYFTNHSKGVTAPVRYKAPYLPDRTKTKPVIFVFPIFLAVGGVERNTIEIMRQLNSRFDFIVITMERLRPEQGSLVAQTTEVAVKVIEMSEIVRHSDYLRVLGRLKSNLQPDVIWVCNGSPWFCDNAANIRKVFHDVPIIDQEVYDVEQGWISRYGEAGIRSFDRFIAVNKKIEERFRRDFLIDPEQIHLIYSAVDTSRIRRFKQSLPKTSMLRAKYGLPVDKQVFTFVARLTTQKCPLEFLKLAKQRLIYDDEYFVMVGDGELAPQVLDFINRHALKNVMRIPYIENTLELHAVSDGIIITSAYEGLPIAMIEALAMGVPVFATDVGDIADVLAEYGGGTVVPVTWSVERMHEAFVNWLRRRNEYALNLKECEHDILERFSSENIAKQYVECWQKGMDHYGRNAI